MEKDTSFNMYIEGMWGMIYRHFNLMIRSNLFFIDNDNPKFDEYCIEMTFGGSGSREKYQIKNTRTMLQNGDRWIVYETSNIEGKSISFIIDPNFRSVIYVSGNMQAIFTNTPKSEWE